MSKQPARLKKPAADRASLRRRVGRFYAAFNRGEWAKCFAMIDPRLRLNGKVEPNGYADLLAKFKEAYGAIRPWYLRISLHLDATKNKHDDRPFAFVYVVWQDERHQFHMFRERWVKDGGRWHTRVVGLVPGD